VVKCWGGNGFGELGVGDTVSRGDGPAEMGHLLPGVALGSGRRGLVLALGTFHSCALIDDGSVKCWGNNVAGQLGAGDNTTRGGQSDTMGDALPAVNLGGELALALSAGNSHSCALLNHSVVKCWGNNNNGQLGQGDVVNRGDAASPALGAALAPIDFGLAAGVSALAAGSFHNCVQWIDGAVKCWGYNAGGQLGLGDVANRGDHSGQMGAALPTVDLGGP
jgi:alpha-tubulin suppressor-like RCC1 family protein